MRSPATIRGNFLEAIKRLMFGTLKKALAGDIAKLVDAGYTDFFSGMAEGADDVVYVSREYREGCMLKCNRYLVDHAACLLAVYNGDWRGGTAMTVRYAQKLGREVIILNPV